jgi:outer membrane receptor protein involved in Fe transport
MILAGVAFAALASAAAPASAQQASNGDPEASAVEDIVVTARRREESLQDVPIAVSAFTEETIENRQLEDLSDIARYTPGVQLQQAFGRDGDRPVIRGASNILISDGKVGVFLDGIPWFGDFTTLDLDTAQRVEVIRGPQSAVFGRGTLSGAINVVTRRPGDDWSGRVSYTAGTDNRLSVSGVISGPLIDGVGVMLGMTQNDVQPELAGPLWRPVLQPASRFRRIDPLFPLRRPGQPLRGGPSELDVQQLLPVDTQLLLRRDRDTNTVRPEHRPLPDARSQARG